MRKIITLTVLGLVLTTTAWAAKGFHYIADTVTTGTNMKKAEKMQVEAWVEGANAKIVFLEVGEANPFLGEGKFLLTNDGGATMYLVDPKENTHSKFDLNQVLGVVGEVADSGMFNLDVSNHSIEQLEKRGGPKMHGYATEYYKYRTTYDLEMKIMGMKRSNHTILESELWSAEVLDASGFKAWGQPRETGFDAVDTLLNGELEKVHGFPFKSVTTTRMEGKKKKKTTETVSTTEVIEFEAMNVADSMFVLDPNSRETSLVDLGGMESPDSGDKPEDEEKGGFMGKFKKLRKGGG